MKGEITMLTSSNVKFYDCCWKMSIQFEMCKLSSAIRESILSGNTEVNINSDKLYLVNPDDKSLIALLYNVELIDARIGYLLRRMCITSDELGFVISPLARWYRDRIIECYKAIKGNLYKAYLNLDELDKGIVYLIIDWKEFFNY